MLSQQYKQHQKILVFIYLELQLLEEPSVLSALVSLLELGADHVSGFLLLHGILQDTEVKYVSGNKHLLFINKACAPTPSAWSICPPWKTDENSR